MSDNPKRTPRKHFETCPLGRALGRPECGEGGA